MIAQRSPRTRGEITNTPLFPEITITFPAGRGHLDVVKNVGDALIALNASPEDVLHFVLDAVSGGDSRLRESLARWVSVR